MNQSNLARSLEALIKKVLAQEKKARGTATVVFVSAAKMQTLNKRYRHKNKATDVLSFASGELGGANGEDKNYLGEIVICLPYLRRQAREYGVPFAEELARMTIHGTLHLLGYDHVTPALARRMLPRQERYLLKFKKIYDLIA